MLLYHEFILLFSHCFLMLFLLYQSTYSLDTTVGHASVLDAEGNLYEGSFSHWKKHGKGKVRTATGEQYTGEWVDGVRQGYGTLIRPDGSRFEGLFDKSRFYFDYLWHYLFILKFLLDLKTTGILNLSLFFTLHIIHQMNQRRRVRTSDLLVDVMSRNALCLPLGTGLMV